jgi:hypothetical protein
MRNASHDTDLIATFGAYAAAFEKAFAADDWTLIEPHFCDDATSIVEGVPAALAGPFRGRDAVIASLRDSVRSFDYRFASRAPRLLGAPRRVPAGVYIEYVVRYETPDGLGFELCGDELDLFRDGRIDVHRERLLNGDEMGAFMARHADRLLPPR